MRFQLAPAFRVTLFLTVLTGLIYPSVVTGLCQMFFPHRANGSLVHTIGSVVGSALIAQNFTQPRYFHPRPSAAGADGYDAANSNASNLGPTSQKLIDRVKGDLEKFRQENPDYAGPVPADLLTTSGSGLDPDLSPASALAQTPRVAKARGVGADKIEQLISSHTAGRVLGFLGEPRVNVLELNLALDQQFPAK